jgi:prephenate dehydratase
MTVAVWIIAICELVRMVQNAIQLHSLMSEAKDRKWAYQEFVDSLKDTDREFVKKMLDEIEQREAKEAEGKCS